MTERCKLRFFLILETFEACLSLKRYIKFCIDDAEVRAHIFKDFIKNIPREFAQPHDLVIVNSHNEDEDGGIYLRDFGFEVLRSYSKKGQPVFVLYENLNGILPEEWDFVQKITCGKFKLSTRIKMVSQHKIIPTPEQTQELNTIYPPMVFDHHHHAASHREG